MSFKEQLIALILELTEADDVDLFYCMTKKMLSSKESKKEKLKAVETVPIDFHEVIYCIKHNVTGKEYIGRTGAFEKRIAYHMSLLRNGKHIVEDMQSDYDKYGEDYTITVLDEITDKEQRKREHELMLSRGSHIRGKGYNYKDECNRCRTRRKAENETKCRKNPIIAD